MNEAGDTSFWQALVLPENPRIASSPSPFALPTKQIRAAHGICGSLDTRRPASGVPCGFGSGHPEARWFRFYGNQRAGRALPRELPNFGVSERTYVSLPRAVSQGPLNSQVVLTQKPQQRGFSWGRRKTGIVVVGDQVAQPQLNSSPLIPP